MLKCILTVGAPASGKSFWAKQEVAKDPNNWVRVNNDDIRAMTNGSVYSADYEKLITETRNFLIREALKRNKNVIIDNVNANKRHFETVCKIAKEMNLDIQVFEKAFYEELDVLLERDSKREGKGQVGEAVVRKWFKELGSYQHKHYKPKSEIFTKRTTAADRSVAPMVQDETKPKSLICDLDGSLATIGNRSPYVASNCDLTDTAKEHIAEIVRLHYNAGYQVIFCSGRMEADRAPTMRFIEKCLPNMPYVLFLRKDNDLRKDHIIKEEIFNEHIKNKYWVTLIIDDRASVCRQWHKMGLNLVRVGDPDADF